MTLRSISPHLYVKYGPQEKNITFLDLKSRFKLAKLWFLDEKHDFQEHGATSVVLI